MEHIRTLFDEVHELVGWAGMLAILGAYAGVSLQLVDAQSLVYQVLNGVGALALVYSTYKTKSYPVLVLNAVWFCIAAFSVVSML